MLGVRRMTHRSQIPPSSFETMFTCAGHLLYAVMMVESLRCSLLHHPPLLSSVSGFRDA